MSNPKFEKCQDGDEPVIEPTCKMGLGVLLDSWQPMDMEFPEINDPPVKAEDIF